MRLLFALFICMLAKQPVYADPPEQRILHITINEAGMVTVVGDTVDVYDVPHSLQDCLFKSLLGNRKYYKISIAAIGEKISLTQLDLLKTKIREGQQLALNAICLEKFKSRYDELDSKKKEKLKKQYPVLFQTNYS